MLTEISYKPSYSKGIDDIASAFYNPSMKHAISYDRISGYFGSSVFIISWSALNTRRVAKYGHGTGTTTELTSLVQCGICGKNYRRKTAKARVFWRCTTYDVRGKKYCASNSIPETTLKEACCQVIGLAEYDPYTITERIERIVELDKQYLHTKPNILRCCTLAAGETHVELPEGIISIEENAFANCDALESISIPCSVTSIKKNAFAGLKNLHTVSVSLDACFSDEPFNRCTGLKTLIVKPVKRADLQVVDEQWTRNFGSATKTIETLVIEDGIVKICKDAFKGFKALRSVTLPESLTELAGLNDCSALETVSLPKKLKKLGDKAFSGCAALRDINLPDSVSTVGDYAFSRCTSLTEPIYTKKGKCLWFVPMNATEFIMPDTVEKIAPTLMYNHKMLKSVVLSTRLKKISAGAFNDCAKLENIVIPEGVQEIERFAFNKCVSLTHVEIPASLTTIRRQAFQECHSLSSFTWTGTGPTKVTDDIFFACPLHGKRIPGMPNL